MFCFGAEETKGKYVNKWGVRTGIKNAMKKGTFLESKKIMSRTNSYMGQKNSNFVILSLIVL